MSFLKSAALFAINSIARFNSPMAVSAVEKTIKLYASRVHLDPRETENFHAVVKRACQVVKAPEDSGSLENFFVGMLKYDLPDELNDDVFKFLVEVARPYGTRINLANFARTTQDPLLAEKAMDTICEIEEKNGFGNNIAIDCLGRVLVLNDNLQIKINALEKLCAIGNQRAYQQAIDGMQAISFFDKGTKYQEYLIDSIIQSNTDDKLSLLLDCKAQGIVVGSSNRKKVFATLCELSKTAEDNVTASALQAANAAVKMFYESEDGEYPYMVDLSQALLDVARKNPSPKSMKPFFAAVCAPEKGLANFVEAKFSIASLLKKAPSIATPNLGEVFGEIDVGNEQKGWATPLKDIYMGLCTATARINATNRSHVAAFGLEKQ